jgi:hypothetical protein
VDALPHPFILISKHTSRADVCIAWVAVSSFRDHASINLRYTRGLCSLFSFLVYPLHKLHLDIKVLTDAFLVITEDWILLPFHMYHTPTLRSRQRAIILNYSPFTVTADNLTTIYVFTEILPDIAVPYG